MIKKKMADERKKKKDSLHTFIITINLITSIVTLQHSITDIVFRHALLIRAPELTGNCNEPL